MCLFSIHMIRTLISVKLVYLLIILFSSPSPSWSLSPPFNTYYSYFHKSSQWISIQISIVYHSYPFHIPHGFVDDDTYIPNITCSERGRDDKKMSVQFVIDSFCIVPIDVYIVSFFFSDQLFVIYYVFVNI